MTMKSRTAWKRRIYAAVAALMLGWSWIAPSQALPGLLRFAPVSAGGTELQTSPGLLPPLPGSLIVTITSPASGATVGGTTRVSASVSIVGSLTVAGVQFRLDGANLGAEDTTAPYSVSWNTTTSGNGSHTLTAVARDAAGNTAASEAVTVTVANAGASYTVIDLGTLGGETSSAQSIDNVDGNSVGWSNIGGGARHAFLYRSGAMTDLGTLGGGSYSQATAVNGAGQVVGHGGINEYGPQFKEVMQAFLWQNGAMQSLGALFNPMDFNTRYGTSMAHGINAIGQVVGESETMRGKWVRHAFLWQNGAMQDIGGGAGDWSISRAFAINDRGQVVGDFAQDAGRLGSTSFNRRAFLWQNGVRLDLGTLPGHTSSTALAINRLGQVIGWSGSSDGSVSRAFLWENGSMRDLGALPGDATSQALAVNASGQVVGWSGTPDRSVSRAFLWQSGRMLDLNSVLPGGSGWVLTEAAAINDAGQIAGTGRHNGQVHAYLLNPAD